MPTLLALTLLLSAVAAAYVMTLGIAALWSRKLQLIGGGRTLVGPLAQLSGILALTPLVLSLLSGGELCFGLGARTRPEALLAQVAGEDVDEWQQRRAEGKQFLYGMAGDFGLLGIPVVMVVWVLVVTHGIRPPRKQQPQAVQPDLPPWRDPDFL
jgi:hypothetical protein